MRKPQGMMSRQESIEEIRGLLTCLKTGVNRSSGMAFHTEQDQRVLELAKDIHDVIAGNPPSVVVPAVLLAASRVVARLLKDTEAAEL
jgi:hypothetical protein